jgi:hypothetical protein
VRNRPKRKANAVKTDLLFILCLFLLLFNIFVASLEDEEGKARLYLLRDQY